MDTKTVLVVDDNPELRTLLCHAISAVGVACIIAENEIDALSKLTPDTVAVIADINLSETGGSPRGGILLAEVLSQRGGPLAILISQTPRQYFSGPTQQDHMEWMKTHKVMALLDRTEDDFKERLRELIRGLR